MRIWVDGWQMQCCGDQIVVGSPVKWGVCAPDIEFLSAVLGAKEAARIDYSEERHDGDRLDLVDLAGTVTNIDAVHVAYRPTEDNPMMLYPVHGSGTTEPRHTATGTEEEIEGRTFLGYLVRLDPELAD